MKSLLYTFVHACSDSASLLSSQVIIVRGRQCIVRMNGWIVVWTSQVPQLDCLYQLLLHMETLSIAGQVHYLALNFVSCDMIAKRQIDFKIGDPAKPITASVRN